MARTGFRRAAAVTPVEIEAAIFAVYAQQLQFPAGWSDDQGWCYLSGECPFEVYLWWALLVGGVVDRPTGLCPVQVMCAIAASSSWATTASSAPSRGGYT